MKIPYILFIVLGTIAIVLAAIVFVLTPCEKVDAVTFGVELEIDDKFKIYPQTTKVCKSQNLISSIPQSDIDEFIALKVALLRTVHNISTYGEEDTHFQEQIGYILDYPEEERSQWQDEYLPQMQQDFSRSKSLLEYEQGNYEKLVKQFEEKAQSIEIIAQSQDELDQIAIQIDKINFYPTVELDQKIYTWTDKVYITIVDPLSDLDPHKLDTIGGRDDRILKIETRRGSIDMVIFMETGVDTGIFTTEITLTGFIPYDVDGDGNLEDVLGKTWHYAGPGGEGRISTDRSDVITVTYEFLDNEKTSTTAKVRWNQGEVQWLEASYPASGTGTVRVIDPDMNLEPESINKIKVLINSSLDSVGFEMYLIETNEATGIFEGEIHFSDKTEPENNILGVNIGDMLTATYIDRTLPDPFSYGDSFEIVATSLIN
ncbi:MAG: hypothetical protein IH841_08195 [Thaumarchaeota archaeon]|nr:hypothetical protein [Nitrososphaerota archaeon]